MVEKFYMAGSRCTQMGNVFIAVNFILLKGNSKSELQNIHRIKVNVFCKQREQSLK